MEESPELEAELITYVQEHHIRYLAGYEISCESGRLELYELEPVVWDQLRLKLDGESDRRHTV